jgi:transketolase
VTIRLHENNRAKAMAPDVVRAAGDVSARAIRRIIIEQSKRAGVGHIGSALSVADIVACIYGGVISIPELEHFDRDRFVLSKGHAALALYAALYLRGWLSLEQLSSFCTDGTSVGVHPEHQLPGIDFSTGSLGQGLSFGVGAALAAKRQGSKRRVYVLVSDAECNEGSIWEGAMFAAHHRLNNLTVVIDANSQQAFGYTRDVINLHPLIDKWKTFGWKANLVPGHDAGALDSAFRHAIDESELPTAIVAETVFGYGVSFMQSQIKWHYSPLSDEEYIAAVAEIGVVL